MSELRGFRHHVSDLQIRDFRRLSALQKLRQLEEMQRFLEMAASAKTKDAWDRLRKAEA